MKEETMEIIAKSPVQLLTKDCILKVGDAPLEMTVEDYEANNEVQKLVAQGLLKATLKEDKPTKSEPKKSKKKSGKKGKKKKNAWKTEDEYTPEPLPEPELEPEKVEEEKFEE